jgi:hypothetical protein
MGRTRQIDGPETALNGLGSDLKFALELNHPSPLLISEQETIPMVSPKDRR